MDNLLEVSSEEHDDVDLEKIKEIFISTESPKEEISGALKVNNNTVTTISPNGGETRIQPNQTNQTNQTKELSTQKNPMYEFNSISNIVDTMLNDTNNQSNINQTNNNGWNENANLTIKNWYKTFRQQSFIYQWVLDRNRRIGDKLSIISVISSSLLGIFSGFKLWIHNDQVFQTTSDVVLMLLNFCVAIITAASKRYIDDVRNEEIRVYVENVDAFLGEIAAQVLKSPVYRMNASDFFNINNEKYTQLITKTPNLSINEINMSKKVYQSYLICTKDSDIINNTNNTQTNNINIKEMDNNPV